MDRRLFVLSNSQIATRNQTFFCNFSNFNWRETNNNRISLNEIFQIKIFIVGNLLDFSFYNWKMGSEIVAHSMNQTSFFLCNLVFWVLFIIKHQINIASNFYLIQIRCQILDQFQFLHLQTKDSKLSFFLASSIIDKFCFDANLFFPRQSTLTETNLGQIVSSLLDCAPKLSRD